MNFQSSDTKIATEHTTQHENIGEAPETVREKDMKVFRRRKSSDQTNKTQIVSDTPKTKLKKNTTSRNTNVKRSDQLALYSPDTAGFIYCLHIHSFFC